MRFAVLGFVIDAIALKGSATLSMSSWLGCEHDSRWTNFRKLLATNADAGFPQDASLLALVEDLLTESRDDLKPDQFHSRFASVAMRNFFETCNFLDMNRTDRTRPEEVASGCLYGAIAALWVKARHRPEVAQMVLELAEDQLGHGGYARCLDFMDSSPWPLAGIDILGNHLSLRVGGGFRLPMELRSQFSSHASLYSVHAWTSGRRSSLPHHQREQRRWCRNLNTRARLSVWEVGVHGPLSAEALSAMAAAVRPWAIVSHRNLVRYQYPEGLPHWCSQLYGPRTGLRCDRSSEDELSGVVRAFLPASSQGLQPTVTDLRGFTHAFATLAWGRLAEVDVLLCTVAALCLIFFPLEKPVLAYIAHRFDFLASAGDAPQVQDAIISLISSRGAAIVVDTLDVGRAALLSASAQRGSSVVMPMSLYVSSNTRWFPRRHWRVLVRDRHSECVLLCLLRHLASEASSPVRFFPISSTSRTFWEFSEYRAVAFFPDNQMQLAFFEFYAVGMPIFMPKSLTAHWNAKFHAHIGSTFNSMTTSPYLTLPHIQHFGPLAELITGLSAPMANLRRVSAAMLRAYRRRLTSGLDSWSVAVHQVMGMERDASCRLVPGRLHSPSAYHSQASAQLDIVLPKPKLVRPCLIFVDLTRYDCGDAWHTTARQLQSAISGNPHTINTLKRLLIPPQRGQCIVGEWSSQAWQFVAVSRSLKHRVSLGKGRQRLCTVARAFDRMIRQVWTQQDTIRALVEQEGLGDGEDAASLPEFFLGGRWPVWELLSLVQASTIRARVARHRSLGTGCQTPSWRSLLSSLSILKFLPSLHDVTSRHSWRLAFQRAGRIVMNGRWRNLSTNTAGYSNGSCVAGLLCSVLLLALQVATRSCLQTMPEFASFLAERAFIESLLIDAKRLFSMLPGVLDLLLGPWPVFDLLSVFGKLNPDQAVVLDSEPRQWIVGGTHATFGEEFYGTAILTSGDDS